MIDLTIVTSCTGYGIYLDEWSTSIVDQIRHPGFVCIYTHGHPDDEIYANQAAVKLINAGIPCRVQHDPVRQDLGVARNRAVEMSVTPWVMHLDADDTLMRHCIDEVFSIYENADIVALGYVRVGDLASGPSNRRRMYDPLQGLEMHSDVSPCSGVSPFRRRLWEIAPYREDLRGAWDTALWLGFAWQNPRVVPSKTPCFNYRQHADSIYNQRRKSYNWTRVLTEAQLKGLRNPDPTSVAVIVPREAELDADRQRVWAFIRQLYAQNYPSWSIVEGLSVGGRHWSKGRAVHDAMTRTNAATIVIADADCWIPDESLLEAVRLVQLGKAAWVVPHNLVFRFTRSVTEQILRGAGVPANPAMERRPYPGFAGGGLLVANRAAFEATGGIPPQFEGWGGEDEGLCVVLDTLLGRHTRLEGLCYHLWHPSQVTKTHADRNRWMVADLRDAARAGPDGLYQFLHVHPSAVTA